MSRENTSHSVLSLDISRSLIKSWLLIDYYESSCFCESLDIKPLGFHSIMSPKRPLWLKVSMEMQKAIQKQRRIQRKPVQSRASLDITSFLENTMYFYRCIWTGGALWENAEIAKLTKDTDCTWSRSHERQLLQGGTISMQKAIQQRY